MREDVSGPYGKAEWIPFDRTDPRAAETVTSYLVTAPGYHPAWDRYLLLVVRLRDDVPGFPPPIRQFDGATHELTIMALNPDGQYIRDKVTECMANGSGLRFLEPQSLSLQFIATDEEMDDLAEWACIGICQMAMSPEKVHNYADHKSMWLGSMTKTLAHIRGEAHAPAQGMPIEINEP